MRKFRQFKDADRKEEKSKSGLYLAIFLAVIMIGGVGGIFLSQYDSGTEYTYGKYTFQFTNNLWNTKINGKNTMFYFLPGDVLRFNVSGNVYDIIKNSQNVIITIDPEENSTSRLQAVDLSRLELYDILSSVSKRAGFAVSKKSPAYNLPVITCDNQSITNTVIHLSYGDESKVYAVNNCITLSATDEQSLLGMTDNLRYRIYEIIK